MTSVELDPILRLPAVVDALGLSKATLWEMVKNEEFPRPRRLRKGGRAVGWKASQVAAYIASLEEVKAGDLGNIE